MPYRLITKEVADWYRRWSNSYPINRPRANCGRDEKDWACVGKVLSAIDGKVEYRFKLKNSKANPTHPSKVIVHTQRAGEVIPTIKWGEDPISELSSGEGKPEGFGLFA